jgi:hypothetical protein
VKKLTIYAMIASCIITLIYVVKLQWFIETDMEFWRATAITALGEVGLWCFYYYSRDYEAIHAHEEHQKRLAQQYVDAVQKLRERDLDKPE